MEQVVAPFKFHIVGNSFIDAHRVWSDMTHKNGQKQKANLKSRVFIPTKQAYMHS